MGKKKSSGILISRKGLGIWISLVIFIAAWMFVLGILVGRGAAPVKLEVGKLEKELAELKAKMLKQEQAQLEEKISGKDGDSSKLGFYEALTSGKKAEPFKSLPPVSVQPKPADPKPVPPIAKPKPASKDNTAKRAPSNSSSQRQPETKNREKKGRFAVQVASSKNSRSAEKLVATLRKRGYKAYQIRTELAGKGVWYRVRVGEYKDRGAAKKILSKLKSNNYSGMVVSIQ